LEKNRKWVGWTGDVVVDCQIKPGSWQGRNFAYRPVVIQGDFVPGERVFVKVMSVTRIDLRAEVIRRLSLPRPQRSGLSLPLI
jgi:tRNA A37 methylthiotransferase MiaB